ncbi:MAG: membrane protease YdiL (CAAX protease family) [Planctomycetota bacterium]|jgi:membrane protease YdiL (CAAX protease family)
MIGILVVFLLTWIVLRFITHDSIEVLGLAPNRRRFKELFVGMLFMAGIGVINFVWQAHFKEISYQLNSDYGVGEMLAGSGWMLRAVVFEELVFRGVLLYLMIKYIGAVRACLVSSLIFGIYHWFSYEIFGSRIVLMIYILLVTGCGGWMFSFAFAKTKSLYAPIGLHLGWNLVSAVVFSAGPLGNQLLLEQGRAIEWSGWVTLLFFSLQAIVAPGVVTWYLTRIYRPLSDQPT